MRGSGLFMAKRGACPRSSPAQRRLTSVSVRVNRAEVQVLQIVNRIEQPKSTGADSTTVPLWCTPLSPRLGLWRGGDDFCTDCRVLDYGPSAICRFPMEIHVDHGFHPAAVELPRGCDGNCGKCHQRRSFRSARADVTTTVPFP